MSSESKTVGMEQWKEATKSWQIYAYNPASRETSKAEVVSSRVRASAEPEFRRETFLGALTKASRRTSEPESEKK